MKKNYVSLIVYAIVLGLIIGLPFAFGKWNDALRMDSTTFALYIVMKVIAGLCFIGFVCFGFLKSMARGTYYYVMVATLMLQLIPLLMRLGLYMSGFKYVYEILLLGISLAAYTSFVGAMARVSKKQLKADQKYEGKTIEIHEER